MKPSIVKKYSWFSGDFLKLKSSLFKMRFSSKNDYKLTYILALLSITLSIDGSRNFAVADEIFRLCSEKQNSQPIALEKDKYVSIEFTDNFSLEKRSNTEKAEWGLDRRQLIEEDPTSPISLKAFDNRQGDRF